jgi:hypothetical protein
VHHIRNHHLLFYAETGVHLCVIYGVCLLPFEYACDHPYVCESYETHHGVFVISVHLWSSCGRYL